MVTLPFPALRQSLAAAPQPLREGEAQEGPNDVPPKPENCGGCEPLAEEPRARETADRVNLSRRFTPWHKATR